MRIEENILSDDNQGVKHQDRRVKKIIPGEKTEFVPVLVDICRKMLSYNASIKAGATSLLLKDILWDPLNQHEIMELIDVSTDHLSSLFTMLSLALRLEAKMVHLQKTHSTLEEIFFHVNRELKSKYPWFVLKIDLPQENRLVYVNFEYLSLTLGYLIDVCSNGKGESHLNLSVIGYEDHWQIIITGLSTDALGLLRKVFDGKFPEEINTSVGCVSTEILLKVELIQELLSLQKIDVILMEHSQEMKTIGLNIPVFH